jgi:L-iditol 2-dehydrogenase
MKALVNHGARQWTVEEWPEPKLRPGDVLVEVAACGICGTDVHAYRGLSEISGGWPMPGVPGHEISGQVLAWGSDVQGFQIGDRVTVQPLLYCGRCEDCRAGRVNLCPNLEFVGGSLQGGYAERTAVPARGLFKLPEKLDIRHASMAETLATPVHAFNRNVSGLLRNVAVFGAGTQGLLSLQIAQLAGAQSVAITDVVARRLAIAQELGATLAFNAREQDPVEAILNMTGGRGVDLAIEAAGKAISRQQALRVVRPGGMAIFIALGAEQTAIDFMSFVPRELQIRGTQCYNDDDFAMAIELLASKAVNVDPLLTGMPLERGSDAFEMLVSDPSKAIKVILEP